MQKITQLVARITGCAQILIIVAGVLLPTSLAQAQSASDTSSDTSSDTWGDNERPENYVRSKGPSAEGDTYNWLQMGYASIVVVAMIGFMLWLVRRTPRKSHDSSPSNQD